LKLFNALVESGKLERALDLVDRLHLAKSFDIAMVISDSNRKLVDLIEEARDRRFGGDSTTASFDEDANMFGSHSTTRQISPDSDLARNSKRQAEDDVDPSWQPHQRTKQNRVS
jgi:hypothetical protein